MTLRPARLPLPNDLALPSADTTDRRSVRDLFPHFDAFARVLNPAHTRDGSPVRWRDVSTDPITAAVEWNDLERSPAPQAAELLEPISGSVDPSVTTQLIRLLTPRTTTPGECFFLVWEGYGDLREDIRDAPQVVIGPHDRRMHILRGPLAAAGSSVESFDDGRSPMWWIAADGAWCVGSDIYARSLYIGGDRPTIDSILADRHLESFAVDADQRIVSDDR